MKTYTLLIAIILTSSINSWAYTSPSSQEAKMAFTHWVELSANEASSEIATQAAIETQLAHMVGPMANAPKIGAPKFDHVVSSVQVEELPNGQFIAHYSYYGTVLFKKGFKTKFALAMPNNPKTIWKTSAKNSQGMKLNPCTDETYQTEGDFAYFWSPDRPGCKKVLKEGDDYTYVETNLNPIANIKRSYPEYSRLVDENGRLVITYLFGSDKANRIRNPFNRKGHDDLNAKSFRAFVIELENRGFTSREWTNAEVKAIVRERVNPLPFVMELTHDYEGDRAKQMVIRMVYTNTQLAYKTTSFLYFLEHTIKNSAIMVFDGHSGIGADVGLPGVRPEDELKFDLAMLPDKYQIFFFNSCSSYSYYNDGVFKRKGGSANLDLLSTGLETAFDGSVAVNTNFVNNFHQWALNGRVTSYQTLTDKLETENLVGVNGDEDNP